MGHSLSLGAQAVMARLTTLFGVCVTSFSSVHRPFVYSVWLVWLHVVPFVM